MMFVIIAICNKVKRDKMNQNFFDIIEKKSGIKLNDGQKKAVLHTEGPALVLAVPGSGKTTMLIVRTANLILNKGINPSSILSVTFNRAAVKDMEDRYNKIFGWAGKRVFFSTIHAFALKIIRAYKRGGSLKIIEGDRSTVSKTSILKKIYYEVNEEYPGDDIIDELSGNIGYIKNMMIEENEIDSHNFKTQNIKEIYKKYEDIKKEHGFIDFDDMLSLCYKILKSSPDILSMIRRQFRYIQVDEFQDNSKIQNEIIKLIASPLNNIFTVADDDQSIYGFRGAFPEGVLNFKEDYNNAGIFYLEQNYRSTKAIVDLSGEFIKSNLKRYNKNIFTENEQGKPVEILEFKSTYEQIKHIRKNIMDKGDFSSYAVLFRNNVSAVAIVDEFERYGIPFYARDNSSNFFKSRVADDIVSFMHFALDNSDINAFKKIYYKSGCFISKQILENALKNYKSGSIIKSLKDCGEINSFQRSRLINFEKCIKSIPYKKPSIAIHIIENDMYYDEYLKNSGKNGSAPDTAEAVLQTLKLIAGCTNTIIEFLARLDYLSKLFIDARSNRGKNAVVLSTLHSSKGLEFTNVYIADLTDGIFPSQGCIDDFEKGDNSALEEERRLFYVGMTRAKKHLSLCAVSSKNGEPAPYSRFVGEVFSIINPAEIEAKK